MKYFWPLPQATSYAQLIKHAQQHYFMTFALLNRRFNAVFFTTVIDRKFTSRVNRKIAAEILGFKQEKVKAATNDEVVDLRYIAARLKPKIVQYNVIRTVTKMRINVVGGVSLAL